MGALRLPITWQMSFLYAIVFGGFVALDLPAEVGDGVRRRVDPVGAGTHTAIFAVAAVMPARSAASWPTGSAPRWS